MKVDFSHAAGIPTEVQVRGANVCFPPVCVFRGFAGVLNSCPGHRTMTCGPVAFEGQVDSQGDPRTPYLGPVEDRGLPTSQKQPLENVLLKRREKRSSPSLPAHPPPSMTAKESSRMKSAG